MKCQADPVGHNCCKILNAFQALAQPKSHHQTFFKTLIASTPGSTLNTPEIFKMFSVCLKQTFSISINITIFYQFIINKSTVVEEWRTCGPLLIIIKILLQAAKTLTKISVIITRDGCFSQLSISRLEGFMAVSLYCKTWVR